jgi:hypothetical protein
MQLESYPKIFVSAFVRQTTGNNRSTEYSLKTSKSGTSQRLNLQHSNVKIINTWPPTACAGVENP